jgi:hypothetical protein
MQNKCYLPEGKENKAKPSGKNYMHYLYIFRMFYAVLAGLCHSGVRRHKYLMRGKNVYPISNGLLCGVPWNGMELVSTRNSSVMECSGIPGCASDD